MRTNHFRAAFLDWLSRHRHVDHVALYKAVLRSRTCSLAQLRAQPAAIIERELHILLFGFGIHSAAAAAAPPWADVMSMWRLETNVNGNMVTSVLASLKIAYLAINSLRGQRCSHIITRIR